MQSANFGYFSTVGHSVMMCEIRTDRRGRLSQLWLWQYFIADRATCFGLNKSHFLTTSYLKVLCLMYLTGA